MAAPSLRSCIRGGPQVIEFLAPLYPTVPCDEDDEEEIYAVELQHGVGGKLEIVFPELSLPGRLFKVDITCVNGDSGHCECRFEAMLRSVNALHAAKTLRATFKYVITRSEVPDGGGEAKRVATLRLCVAIHEKADPATTGFDYFVLEHLQASLFPQGGRDERDRGAEVEKARTSKCHVVGCMIHSSQAGNNIGSGMKLEEIFRQLTETEHPASGGQSVKGWYDIDEELRRLTDLPRPMMHLCAPCVSDGEDQGGLVLDLLDGRLVARSSVTPPMDIRGGLFCDEPGLGKTITMLALILMTKGIQSDPRDLVLEAPDARKTSLSLRDPTRGRELDLSQLLPSAASLIVVPGPLLEHWRYQIKLHLQRRVLKAFVDDADFKTSDLPSPRSLAAYDVVITTFERLSHQRKFHKPKSASEQNRPNRYGFEDAPERFIDGRVNRGTSPLLMVHWVRIVVDEGHKLGGRRSQDHMLMAELLHASKRWVMTGTPTPHTAWSADLRHMHGLLVFLRDRPYGEADGKTWARAISRPFESGDRAGYVRLLHLLQRIMMRHTKDSILKQIPMPIRRSVSVYPTPREYAVYNGVAAVVRANLVITSKTLVDPVVTHKDSLLHRDNLQFARSAVQNLRSATHGGGSISVKLADTSLRETVKALAVRGVPPERVAEISNFLTNAVGIDVLTLCALCGRHLPVLMLIPCGHLSCADCVEAHITRIGQSCEICRAEFDWDDLQKIQPGFEVKIIDDNWDYDHGDAADSNQQPAPNGKKPKRKRVAIDLTRFVTVDANKTFYVSHRITELRKEFDQAKASGVQDGYYWDMVTHKPKPLKAIVYSRSRELIYRVKVSLAQHGVQTEDFMVRTAAARLEALVSFRNNPKSNVLLMTDSGSHGLDLSFVTHVFLMEQIFDKSLEKQIVARAHRMGAQHSVIVEKILMRGTLEETSDMPEQRRQFQQTKEDDGSLIRSLLRNLRLIQESDVAQFGYLKYEMRVEGGAEVKEANVLLPNPGKKPSIATYSITSEQSEATSAAENSTSNSSDIAAASAVSTTAAPQPNDDRSVERSRPAVRFVLPESRPPEPPTNKPSLRQEPQPSDPMPRAKSVAEPMVERKPVFEEKIKIKTELPQPAPKQKRKRPPPPPVIDLTADSDSDSEIDDSSTSRVRTVSQTTYSGSFYKASSEEDSDVDDSETDDEWVAIKEERVTQKSSLNRSRAKETKRIRLKTFHDGETGK